MAEEAVVERRPAGPEAGGDDTSPEGASPSRESRREPPEQNKVGELERLLKKQGRELEELRKGSQRSKENEVLATGIKALVQGNQPGNGRPDPGPMPDQYEDPAAYDRWLQAKIDARAEEIADRKLQGYDRTRRTQDTQATQEELNATVTQQFVESRTWLQNEDGSVNREALDAFQKHIDEVGIEGRGKAGSLTLRQLEAAERDFRFDQMMSEEGSRIQGDMVDRQRSVGRGSAPRGRGDVNTTFNDELVANRPEQAIAILRQTYEVEGEAAMMRRFDSLSEKSRNLILPRLRGAER